MANFCLNVNNFSEEHKKALETLINVVKDYGFTEAAARIKVFSYIEELSEKYFIKEANKYDTEKAVEQIMQDIAKLSKPEKIGKKIISDIIDLKPVNNLNTVQTIISPKPFISNNEKKIESKTLYITRPKRDGSYNSAYSDYLAFKNEDKENIIQYNSKDGVDNFILKIKELMLSGKYTNLKIASDLGSFDPNFYKAIMSKEFENKAFPTKEEISENITKLRLTSIGYKPKGVLYSIIKGQNSEGLLRERKVYFYSMQHKMLWESMCRIRDRKFNKQQVQESYDRMFKGEPNLTNRDVDRMNYFIYQLETLQEPKDELDYYESGYDENGNFLESTQLKISNIRKEFINYKGYNKGQKQYLERVLKYELSRYTNPGDKLNDSYKTMLIHAITKDKAALQSLKLTGYNKLLYGNTENFHTIILTKLRDIVRMDSNYAQYKYTSIDTDPEQPLNTLNTLAFKIANLKAVPKYDFPTNIHFENQSKLTETYSAKEIADLVEATAARIDFWLSSLQGDDPRAYAYRKSYFTAIKEGKIKAVLGDIAKEEEQQVLENLTDSFINQKLHNYKNYTPEMWIQDLGGLEAFMQLVYKYDLGPNSLRYPIEKLIMDKNERDLIAKRRESVLQRMTPDLFKEIFQMAINKSISLSNFVIDRNYEDFSIEESESEEIEDIEESGWADPGINKPAFITKTSSTVSQEVKSFLSCIKVYNADGTISVDITGFPKLLSFTSAYGKIQEICGNILITTHEDIINELKKHYDTEPWLKQVVLMIEKDSKMAAKFVAAFNVDFIPSVGISRKGEVSLNLKAGAISLKDNWINEIQSGNYDWNSVIFDSNGIINADKVKTVPTLIPRDDIASRLYMVGIKNIPLELLNNLNDYQKKYIEKQINLILVACSKIDKDSANNIIRQASTIYNNIASFLYTYLHVESADASYNVQKNGKIVQQFSYVYNNYLSRISQKIKQLFKTPFTERIKVMENADFISKNPYNFLEDFPIFLYISSVENNEEDVGSIKSITTIEDKEISSVVNEDDYIKSAFYQYIKAMNTVENSNSNSMYYFLPPLSDSGNLLAIKLPIIWNTDNVYYESNSLKKSNEDNPNAVTGKQLLQDLIIHNIFREFCRIKDVSNNKTVLNKVKGYETAGKHFHKLPALDSYINELLTINNNIDVIQRLQEILFNEKDGIITKMTSSFVEKLNTIYKTEIERGKLNDSEFEEFYLNNLLAQWNINDILFTDMAFFKYNGVSSTADFIKRIKGVFGRTTKGDIAQLDNPNCRMAYVKFGIRKKHPMQKYATEILKNSSIANTAEAKVIEKIWQDKIEGADGQGFMTAKGLRAWGKLYGYDSEYIEGFLERAKNQQLTAEDYNFVFSIKKPYVYSQVTDQTSKTQIPTIVKNSLALLIPGLTPPNTIYDALMQFAEEHDLDQIQLDSAVKIGGYNIFDVDSMMEDIPEIGGGNKLFKRMQEAKEKMDNESGLDSIHEIPYEDFGEQTRTETQHDKIKLGIQVMKVMFSDIKNEQAVAAKFNGKDLNGTEYKNVYLSALAAKLNLNYSKVAGIFAQSNTLEHALKSLAISSGKFTMNDLQDIDLSDENVLLGALAPTHLNKYYTLVRGLAKHIAEINVPGKTMIQMSGVAYDEDLHIVFEDVATGTEIISNEANIGTLKDLLKEGKLRIKHIDAYCGVYNNDLYTYLINSETGLIDEEKVNNLPTDVKEFMAYRVPTEGNCSVFPCKIKKFLNRYAGDAIVLPKEIVLLTGSDFDVDKDFCHFPEITVRPNAKKNMEDPKTAYEIYKQELYEKYGKVAELNMLSFDNWIMQNKDKYYFTAEKVKYDTKGDIAENLRRGKYKKKEINNILFDLHMSRLRAQDSTYNMFVSSNFEMVKKISNLMTIATNIHSIDVNNIKNEKLKDIIIEFKNAIKSDNEEYDITKKGQKTLEVFNKYWDSSEIYETEALGIEENFEVLPIADIREMWKNLDQNSQGSSIIGRFAILKATLSQIQGSGMTINPVFGVSLDGIKYNNISNISVAEKSILKNFVAAQFLAAAVDNGKDPRAGKLNINSITINAVTTMIALGMPMEKIALIMTHPAIKELTETCKKSGLKFTAATLENNVSFDKNISGLTSGKLLLDIVTNSRTSDKAVLGLMHKIMIISEDMTRLTMALRSDKASAGLPSLSIYAAVNTVRSTRKFIDDLNTGKTVFMLPENSRFFENLDNIASNSTNILPDLNTELGDKGFGQNRAYPNFFRLFGTVLPYRLMSSKFFETSENADYILDQVESNLGISLYANDIKNVLQAWVRYNMMKLPTFADEYDKEGNLIQSSSDKFELYLKGFPKYFVKTALDLKKLPEFKDNYILSNIGKYLAGSDRLAVNSLNKVDKSTIEQAQNAWKELLESKDKKARDLGMGLYVYMLYTNGGYFEGVGFSQFSTIDMMNLIPGYTEMLQSLSKNELNDEDILNFIVQAAANNVVDAKAVTEKSPYSVNTTYGKNFGKDTIQIMNKSNQPLPLLLRVATKEEGEEKKTTKLYMFIEDSHPYITQNKDVYTQGIYKKVPDIKYKPKYENYTLNMNPNVKWNNAEFDDNRLRPISIKENGTEYLLEEELSVIINDIEQL